MRIKAGKLGASHGDTRKVVENRVRRNEPKIDAVQMIDEIRAVRAEDLSSGKIGKEATNNAEIGKRLGLAPDICKGTERNQKVAFYTALLKWEKKDLPGAKEIVQLVYDKILDAENAQKFMNKTRNDIETRKRLIMDVEKNGSIESNEIKEYVSNMTKEEKNEKEKKYRIELFRQVVRLIKRFSSNYPNDNDGLVNKVTEEIKEGIGAGYITETLRMEVKGITKAWGENYKPGGARLFAAMQDGVVIASDATVYYRTPLALGETHDGVINELGIPEFKRRVENVKNKLQTKKSEVVAKEHRPNKTGRGITRLSNTEVEQIYKMDRSLRVGRQEVIDNIITTDVPNDLNNIYAIKRNHDGTIRTTIRDICKEGGSSDFCGVGRKTKYVCNVCETEFEVFGPDVHFCPKCGGTNKSIQTSDEEGMRSKIIAVLGAYSKVVNILANHHMIPESADQWFEYQLQNSWESVWVLETIVPKNQLVAVFPNGHVDRLGQNLYSNTPV